MNPLDRSKTWPNPAEYEPILDVPGWNGQPRLPLDPLAGVDNVARCIEQSGMTFQEGNDLMEEIIHDMPMSAMDDLQNALQIRRAILNSASDIAIDRRARG